MGVSRHILHLTRVSKIFPLGGLANSVNLSLICQLRQVLAALELWTGASRGPRRGPQLICTHLVSYQWQWVDDDLLAVFVSWTTSLSFLLTESEAHSL